MKNKACLFNWQEQFDKAKSKEKINYDLLYSNNIEILKNNFEPYQTDYYLDIFLEKGSVVVMLDMKKYELQAPALFLVQENNELEIISYSNDIKIHYLVIAPSLKDNFLTNNVVNTSYHNKVKAMPLYSLESREKKIFTNLFKDVKKCLSYTTTPYRIEAVTNLTRAYYYLSLKEKTENVFFNDYGVCEKFFNLLNEYETINKDTNFYAESCNLSKGYFEFVIKSNTGKTPKRWIDEKLANECKKRLLETDYSTEKIAEDLGFNSLANFSNFFKRMVNLSPSEFRRRNK